MRAELETVATRVLARKLQMLPTEESRLPRDAGLDRKRGTDPLAKIARLKAARPAFDAVRYFPAILVADRRADVTQEPAGGE